MKSKVSRLDVRDEIRSGRDPFSRIMQAVAALEPKQDLLLIAPFEPLPLYGVLARQGFSHESKATPEGDYEVRFTRGGGVASHRPAPAQPARPEPAASGEQAPVVEVDARGLEPPGPLVKILEAVAALPKGASLRAHTDRRPMHLYPHLTERGFVGESVEQPDGSFITHVRPR